MRNFLPFRTDIRLQSLKKQQIYSLFHPWTKSTFSSIIPSARLSMLCDKLTDTSKKIKHDESFLSVFGVDLADFTQDRIRNFAVIAHIDHGKTTLSRRLLEETNDTMQICTEEENRSGLDSLKVEQERGITVKAHTTSMVYRNRTTGERFLLNLIDTPGHVDFSYEVSRALHASQGVLLIVDSTQGVQAQTMANFYLAYSANLTIIPVLSKIDMPNTDIPRVLKQLKSSFDIREEDVLLVGFRYRLVFQCSISDAYFNRKTSGKTGEGIQDILSAILYRIPPPEGDTTLALRALLFDNSFDRYRGVLCLVRIFDGSLRKGDRISSSATGRYYEVLDVGVIFRARRLLSNVLSVSLTPIYGNI